MCCVLFIWVRVWVGMCIYLCLCVYFITQGARWCNGLEGGSVGKLKTKGGGHQGFLFASTIINCQKSECCKEGSCPWEAKDVS